MFNILNSITLGDVFMIIHKPNFTCRKTHENTHETLFTFQATQCKTHFILTTFYNFCLCDNCYCRRHLAVIFDYIETNFNLSL